VSATPDSSATVGADAYVSTGRLPPRGTVARWVAASYEELRAMDDGAVSQVYPALARADPSMFGIAVIGVDGHTATAGDARAQVPIMSVAKPFVYGLVCDAIGADEARSVIGANATGLPFNATEAVERSRDGRTNPMVNPGAIATTSLIPGDSPEEQWRAVADGLSRFAGRELALDEETYASASATNHRNRELAALLADRGAIRGDPAVALDLYTRQSCLAVSALDLAVMGATLADGGVNPLTGEQVVDGEVCHFVLAAMITAGLYETSGDWLHDVGLPAKSGIGGGIVTVSPGKGGLGTVSPPLDGAGNSVRGQLVARTLSRRLGLDLLASEPFTAALP
jgi:glutaminase